MSTTEEKISTEEKMSKTQVWIYGLAIIVASIGAINWGTIGCCDYNFVSALLPNTKSRNILYIIVGIAGLLAAFSAVAVNSPVLGTNAKLDRLFIPVTCPVVYTLPLLVANIG